ncbi:MAG: DUF4339 domain-containing protein [Opitutales bacterium]
MHIYLHQNNQQEGPFTLPRISARLVSGDLDSATLAWHEGMDTWYPLTHEKWQALGIVAPAPKPKPAVQENTPVVQEAENDNDSPEVDVSSEPAEDESVAEPESGAESAARSKRSRRLRRSPAGRHLPPTRKKILSPRLLRKWKKI